MAELVNAAETMVAAQSRAHSLRHEITYTDVFEHTENGPEAVAIFERALDALGMTHGEEGSIITPSEDFSAFTKIAPGAMCFLGAGRDLAPVHTPDYDWPDDLTPVGTHLFERVARDLLG